MPTLRALALCAVATLAFAAAGATTLSSGQTVDATAPAPALGTRDQLRDCMLTEDSLRQRFQAIDAASAVNQKLAKRVDDEARRLDELHEKLDHDSDVAVKGYNQLISEHNQHVNELNAQAKATNPAGEAYTADLATYHRRCAGLRYSMDDMDAVMQERRKAGLGAPAKP